jgi:hypothetical protein
MKKSQQFQRSRPKSKKKMKRVLKWQNKKDEGEGALDPMQKATQNKQQHKGKMRKNMINQGELIFFNVQREIPSKTRRVIGKTE